MTVEEAMNTRRDVTVRIDFTVDKSFFISPSGSNSWITIGDMKRILISHDALVAEVERLRGELASWESAESHAAQRVSELLEENQTLIIHQRSNDGILDSAMRHINRLSSENVQLRDTLKGAHVLVNEAQRLRESAERDNKNLTESCERQAQLYISAAQRSGRYREALERIAAGSVDPLSGDCAREALTQ
jgi:cell division septum initiation protein DivIVA